MSRKEKDHRYYEKHKDSINAKNKLYRELHKEEAKERQKRFKEKHKKLTNLQQHKPEKIIKFPDTAFWANYTTSELEELINRILIEYQEKGFPYYIKPEEKERIATFNKLNKSWKHLIVNKIIKQTMQGLKDIWAYFPHSWSVKCNKALSPMEVFNDVDLFKKAIIKRLKHGTYLGDSGIQKALKTASGTQTVSNFRPTAASAIYDYFGGGNIYDMSAGYGGRLLGALTCPKVISYTGVEPCIDTYNGLVQLEKDFNFNNKKVCLFNIGSELYVPEKNSIDICFTSPPYFDTEKYDSDITQSYIKYPTYKEWLDGFVKLTIENCNVGLKPTGYLIYNIANTKNYPHLVDDVVKIAESAGFNLIDTFQLSLSSIMKSGYKYEPVLIFNRI